MNRNQGIFVRLPLIPRKGPAFLPDMASLAEVTGTSWLTVKTWLSSGMPRAQAPDGSWGFDKEDVNNWLRDERELGWRRYYGLPVVDPPPISTSPIPCVVCGQWGVGRRAERTVRVLLTDGQCPYCGQMSMFLRHRDIVTLWTAGYTRTQILAKLRCSQGTITLALRAHLDKRNIVGRIPRKPTN